MMPIFAAAWSDRGAGKSDSAQRGKSAMIERK
jgi:hypothetical protein